jgi:hypothetical protein
VGGLSWGSNYMKTLSGKPDPALMVQHDPWYAAHPEAAWALAS